jgi:hypothetical protein
MALDKGDKVVIVGERTNHGFKDGDVVTYTGLDYPKHHKGQWRQFKDAEGFHQYLLEDHYEAYVEPTKVVVVKHTGEAVVAETLPTKAAYAVFNANDEIVATSSDREYARELKAALGGKRKGIRIFSYTAEKEIR